MTSLFRIVLLNPNTDRDVTRAMVDVALADAPPGISIEGWTVSSGDALITNEAALKRAEPIVLTEGRAAASKGFDGVVVAGFGDPGLVALRNAIDVPTVGIAEAGMAEAARIGGRFSVVTTTPDLLDAIRRTAADYGLADRLASVRCTPGDPAVVMADPPRLAAALVGLSRDVVAEDGAGAILVGGGPLARAALAIAQQLPVPVVEPVRSAVHVLYRMMLIRRHGPPASSLSVPPRGKQ